MTTGSVQHWLNVSSYENYNNNGSSEGTISKNATTTINGTTEGSSTPQLWDLRWFALLSGPLLFGTIILPLITGPTIRYFCQSYVKLRVYWRLGFVLLATVHLATCLMLNLNEQLAAGSSIYFELSSMPLIIIIIYEQIVTLRLRKSRRIWIRVSLVVPWLCLVIDFITNFYASFVPIPLGFVVWVAFIVVRMILSRRKGVAKNSTASE